MHGHMNIKIIFGHKTCSPV